MASVVPDDGGDDTIVHNAKRGKFTLIDWAIYKIDNVASSQGGQVKILAFISISFALIAGALEMEISEVTFDVGVWEAWTYMADPGTHEGCIHCVDYVDTETGDTSEEILEGYKKRVNWDRRILAIGIAWGGILFFAVVIGCIIDAIQEKMEGLKKGKSNVVERGHTVMLGWNQLSLDFIREICDANESDGGGVIVVMSDHDKQELEQSFWAEIKKAELMGTKVVFRKGSVANPGDLIKAAAHTARAVLVLSQLGLSADLSDAQTVRTILVLHGLPHKLSGYIVAEILDVDNEPLAHMVGGATLETVVSHDLIGRLMLMSARTPGLAKVYTEVLGFSGDEFYMAPWPAAAGFTFNELQAHFPDAIPLGVQTAKGGILLNPGDQYRLAADDQVIVLAEDDDTYKFEKMGTHGICGNLPAHEPEIPSPEIILMAGWRRDIRDILLLLDSMVVKGTEVHMLAEVPISERRNRLLADGLDPDNLQSITVVHHYGRTASRKVLSSLPIKSYSSVMILADETNENDVMSSDSHTLATLLLFRNLQEKVMGPNSPKASPRTVVVRRPLSSVRRTDADSIAAQCPVISEILDSRTQKTVQANREVACAGEFVESNKMISQILSMVAENRGVKSILAELLGVEGTQLMVNDSKLYIAPEETANFFTVSQRAHRRGEILCGFQDANQTVINPRDKGRQRRWAGCDFVVLSAHDGGNVPGAVPGAGPGAAGLQDEDGARQLRKGSMLTPQEIMEAAEHSTSTFKKRAHTKSKAYNLNAITKKHYIRLEDKLQTLEEEIGVLTGQLKFVLGKPGMRSRSPSDQGPAKLQPLETRGAQKLGGRASKFQTSRMAAAIPPGIVL